MATQDLLARILNPNGVWNYGGIENRNRLAEAGIVPHDAYGRPMYDAPLPVGQASSAPQPMAFAQQQETSPQVAQAAPQASPQSQRASGGGFGGFLSNLFQDPVQRDRNLTQEWLVKQGEDPARAQLIARNPQVLQSYLMERTGRPDPTKQLQAEKLGLEVENLKNPKPSFSDQISAARLDFDRTNAELTSDIREYQAAKKQGYAGTLHDWILETKKASATTINNNPEGSMFAGLPKDVRDEMFKRQGEAQDASDLIDVTNQGRQLLDQGAITGAGSGAKIAAIKWAQTLGVPVPEDVASVVNNTEAYRSIMAKAVGKVIKNFGSGTGLSDADRQYAERLAGGDTTLNEPAIRRILEAGAKQSEQRITHFTTMRDKVLGGDLGALLNVQMPEAGSPEPPAAPLAPGASSDAPPSSYEGDPGLWKYMTPEQRKLWQ